MSEISIKRAHHSTQTDAKKMAEKIAAKLEKDYQLKSSWSGDVLNFTRSGVHGTLDVTASDLKIHMKLGFLMAAFKSPIQEAVEKNLDALVKPAAKPHSAATAKAAETEKAAAKKPAAKAKK
jgi:putative polyhydroxyalkanoate system protein